MDSSQSASFIPKSPVRGTVNRRRVRKVYVFTYLIYIFFIGTLIASGVTWFYHQTVANKLEATKVALNEQRAKFSQADLNAVNDFNVRLQEVRRIVDRQVSLPRLLQAIESKTVRVIGLSGFEYTRADNSELQLTMTAEARDFNATLFQRQVLRGDSVLAEAELTDVTYAATVADNPTAGGRVTFTITLPVTPSLTAGTPVATSLSAPALTLPPEETLPAAGIVETDSGDPVIEEVNQ